MIKRISTSAVFTREQHAMWLELGAGRWMRAELNRQINMRQKRTLSLTGAKICGLSPKKVVL